MVDHRLLLLLLHLVRPTTAWTLGPLAVLPILYQSKDITFSDWVSVFTLCFTPLLAHIIAGTPDVVCLEVPRTNFSWLQKICHYNPTTIIWRYFAIADRRIRAKAWDTNHLAASNSLFWTRRGWDGSEAMIERSRRYCIKPPECTRSPILSKSFAKTVIVTVQGVQAAYALIGGLSGSSDLATSVSISSIFFPLAVIGLLRLFAAPWLTDDFVYAEGDRREPFSPVIATRQQIRRKPVPHRHGMIDVEDESPVFQPYSWDTSNSMKMRSYSGTSTERLLSPILSHPEAVFHSTSSWRARFFRLFFTLPILGLTLLSIFYLVPWSASKTHPWYTFTLPPTIFLVIIFYLLYTSVTFLTFSYYFLRGLSETTVIPCIISTWYQVYTVILILMMVTLTVVATIETRKAPCGIFTSWPTYYNVCPGPVVTPNATSSPFGLAIRSVAPENATVLPDGQFRIENFDGWCTGIVGRSMIVVSRNGTSSAG
ncbi:hypothetical protein B2J93_9528 [Marssonina coronariae]|uniref:Uncharacterized protein n=1 Tax=Diplocarpon coronariae TaxID=2795749 RepID=A0A218ZH61_9HELO|nr:hypothetical protein B2J93_9528 [Marssonina coronariae]